MTVQLVHYDSDKSRGGRAFFITSLRGHMDESTVLVVDDINDDLFFSELAAGRSDVAVFSTAGSTSVCSASATPKNRCRRRR